MFVLPSPESVNILPPEGRQLADVIKVLILNWRTIRGTHRSNLIIVSLKEEKAFQLCSENRNSGADNRRRTRPGLAGGERGSQWAG